MHVSISNCCLAQSWWSENWLGWLYYAVLPCQLTFPSFICMQESNGDRNLSFRACVQRWSYDCIWHARQDFLPLPPQDDHLAYRCHKHPTNFQATKNKTISLAVCQAISAAFLALPRPTWSKLHHTLKKVMSRFMQVLMEPQKDTNPYTEFIRSMRAQWWELAENCQTFSICKNCLRIWPQMTFAQTMGSHSSPKRYFPGYLGSCTIEGASENSGQFWASTPIPFRMMRQDIIPRPSYLLLLRKAS